MRPAIITFTALVAFAGGAAADSSHQGPAECCARTPAASASPLTNGLAERRTVFATAIVLEGDELFMSRPGASTLFPMPPDHAGTIHVFARDAAGGWTERAKVGSASAGIEDGFGLSLAVRGNLMVVGAPLQNGSRGAIYVFERTAPGAQWRQSARLIDSGGSANDQLGASVAIAGDVLFAGAPGRNSARGAVLGFTRGASGWALAATLQRRDAGAGDRLGTSLSADGTRLLAGAPGPLVWMELFGGQQPRPGNAVVFARDAGGAWREEARLSAGNEPLILGAAVQLTGDEALVSAPLANQAAGAIVRFTRSASGWSEAGRFTAASTQGGTFLGVTLARAGNDLIAGAPLLHGVGAAFVFRRNATGGWGQTQVLNGTQNFGFFGGAVALLGDLAVIGAPGSDFFEGVGITYRKDATGQWTKAASVMTEPAQYNAITGSQRSCQNGRVDAFGCSGVDLLAFLPTRDIGGERGVIINAVWGWTDAQSGKEYAIVGRNTGTSFVDISDPSNPRYLGNLPLHQGAEVNVWRELKVYNDHVFIVADGAGKHGMQVFDLRKLRDVQAAPVTFTETAHYAGIDSAHNIAINEASGFAYITGANGGGETCGGGLHMVDIRDPDRPRFAGCFSDRRTGNARTGYSHDAQCIIYQGPDAKYRDHEICFGANETALSVADVTDKQKPVAIATASYPNVVYLHQGWVSDDHRYLYMNDEGDEISGAAPRTRTLVFDIADLDDPVLAREYLGETSATDHNLYVRGNYVFESNYVAGLRILDIRNPTAPVEVGFFDTVPVGPNAPGFAGTWNNYPFFRSGTIVVGSLREGLFLLKQARPVS